MYLSYQEFLEERESLKKIISAVDRKLKSYPEGKLFSREKKGKNYYYVNVREEEKLKEVYLRKNSRQLLDFAKKEYYVNFLEDRKNELAAVEEFLNLCSESKTAKFLNENPSIAEILDLISDEKVKACWEWANADYIKGTMYPENLIHPTLAGYFVRSKSEARIADLYHTMGIPVRYENGILLPDGRYIFTDFTLISLVDYRKYYHEHAGMIDKDDYFKDYETKVRDYRSIGIYPGDNLLITYETENSPLNLNDVRYFAEQYLLPKDWRR